MTGSAELWSWNQPRRRLRKVLERGGVLVIPTESSYALAADPRRRDGVDTVFRIKRRPADQPLPVVVGEIGQLAALGVELPPSGLGGLERAWPGALSVVLPCAVDLPAAASSGRLAVRVPGHERLRRLLCELGYGLTATSANRHGEAPVLEPQEAVELVSGENALVIDDGTLPGGEPSTMVALEMSGGVILRRGRVPRRRLIELAPGWFSAATVEISVEEDD